MYDCAIIGGGLAGLSLSIQLARQGWSVVLFEKNSYPFHRVCGEYISNESFDFLEELGVPLSKMNLPMITELKVSSVNGNFFQQKMDMGGFGISRYTLDHLLAQIAIEEKVTLLQNTKVENVLFENDNHQIITTEGIYLSKIVCGCFGKQSLLEGKVRPKPPINKNAPIYIGVKYHIKLDFPDNRIELHNFKNGYCGISKVDDNTICLCYLTKASNLSDNGNNIKRMEQNVVMANPFLKAYFTNAQFLFDNPVTISHIAFEKKSTVNNHIVFIGDSAGTIAPICGNGMSMALHASKLAFNEINLFLNGSITRTEFEQNYIQKWNSEFSNRIRIGKMIQNLTGNIYSTLVVIFLLRSIKPLTKKLIKMTHGGNF